MSKIDFPEIDEASLVFGGYPQEWFKKTLEQSKVDGQDKFVRIASSLFFNGGHVETDNDLPEDYVRRGLRMLKCVLASFAPKHEHKEAVAGYILQAIWKKE